MKLCLEELNNSSFQKETLNLRFTLGPKRNLLFHKLEDKPSMFISNCHCSMLVIFISQYLLLISQSQIQRFRKSDPYDGIFEEIPKDHKGTLKFLNILQWKYMSWEASAAFSTNLKVPNDHGNCLKTNILETSYGHPGDTIRLPIYVKTAGTCKGIFRRP